MKHLLRYTCSLLYIERETPNYKLSVRNLDKIIRTKGLDIRNTNGRT